MIRLNPRIAAMIATGAGAVAVASAFVGEKEGLSLTAYQDGAKVWTICRGHTKTVKPGMRATPDQCDTLFAQDLADTFAQVDDMIVVPMSEARRAALGSFCFNVGFGACRSSTLVRKINGRDPQACGEILRWKYITRAGIKIDCSQPGNLVCRGIWERRQQEYQLCQL